MSALSERGVAKVMLEAEVATFRPDEPFRYTSGILSPIYLDNRVLISHPDHRKAISIALEALARKTFPKIDVLAGTATAGIPWTAWLAEKMNIPMVYVRGQAKRHGQKNQIEGVLPPGSRTLVIEDLISTGQSALGAVQAVRKAGSEPLGVAAIYTYEMQTAQEEFRKAGVPLVTLTNFKILTEEAEQRGQLTEESKERVLEWAKDPAGWGKKMGFEK